MANVDREKVANVSGREFYAAIYRNGLEAEAAWLRYGAAEKANSVEWLLQRHQLRPRSLCELGCGTGAVICELQRRGLAQELIAVDYSSDAINYLRERARGINCFVADITDRSFSTEGTVDVAVLSHVLEHLEDPLAFLRTIAIKVRPRHLVVEVPLEDLLGGRVKNVFQDRRLNGAGHVQFFTASSFRRCLEAAGWRIVDHRRYVPSLPREAAKFVCKKNGLSGARSTVMTATSCLSRLTSPVWQRVYYAHYAALCELASS